ncbi:hypothetical protein [Croceicoccus gelatinilyticus]|uniref:hypothetical protein n=1 Tax=Croceicoccus gelatinilyticus TaxID=2835536 RepID=UPI001BCD511D|nr:hypothetical protein [Croceicoccus gelatinilyticus]MBS7671522.1 hypothetical protein [Croceicoccus gelatinilyticus]
MQQTARPKATFLGIKKSAWETFIIVAPFACIGALTLAGMVLSGIHEIERANEAATVSKPCALS